jgi:nuclear pore complex protein Nup54
MSELLLKWHPASTSSPFQAYFYQNVGADRAPYFGVPEGEDPRKWEEALQQKPSEGSIPVIARGFGEHGIAGRIKMQDAAVKALYERVHEIDSSLRTRIEEHDLKFTVRTQEARRRHVALSRRCLALATKVQVLRNRGYALDAAEEELKAKLAKLENESFDPVINGRQEELWARMTVVRERARMLKEETERLGKKAEEVEGIDEGTMVKIKQVSYALLISGRGVNAVMLMNAIKILTDYDSQLAHLHREVDMIKKDFEEWDASTKPGQAPNSKR